MTFHPDDHTPNCHGMDCMSLNGEERCAGYISLYEDWQRQRREIQRLLEELAALHKQVTGKP